MSVKKTSYIEHLQDIANEFFEETGEGTVSTHDIANWAMSTGRWEPPNGLISRKCREDFARALRQEYIHDGNNRPIRVKHAARIRRDGQQLTLWADIRQAPRSHMEVAFQQRREQVVGDCCQLDADITYYNSIHDDDKPIQMVFDFTDDVEEARTQD